MYLCGLLIESSMKITIAGAGQVGSYLARYLSTENQDIYIVDPDPERLRALDMDFNLMTVMGDPVEFSALRDAKADKADMFIAVTPVTSDNLVACGMAKSMGARLTVARVDRAEYAGAESREVLARMGVDKVIFPELLASETILDSLRHPWTRNWHEFPGTGVVMLAVRVKRDAPISGKPLRELSMHSGHLHVSAVRRGGRTLIPYGDTIVESDDVLYLTTVGDGVRAVKQLAGRGEKRIHQVLISGGGKLARTLVARGRGEFSFTILEEDMELCRRLTRECPHCRIINGDASDDSALEQAGLFDSDAFIALSESDQSNILDCMSAGEAGVGKRIAEIERDRYLDKAEALGISSIINKQHITASAIFQLMLDADAASAKCLPLTDAEVGRLCVVEGSWLSAGMVKDLRLPHELTFAAMIRGGHGELVTGTTRLEPGDEVIVFCLSGALHKVEKLFGR